MKSSRIYHSVISSCDLCLDSQITEGTKNSPTIPILHHKASNYFRQTKSVPYNKPGVCMPAVGVSSCVKSFISAMLDQSVQPDARINNLAGGTKGKWNGTCFLNQLFHMSSLCSRSNLSCWVLSFVHWMNDHPWLSKVRVGNSCCSKSPFVTNRHASLGINDKIIQ